MTDRDEARETLRSDAERNRHRIADAARAAFRELGADAPIKEIAKRAGVGTATLYRRFPTREDLLAYVFADRLTGCEESVLTALTNPDPWQGLVDHVNHLAELQLEDRAFTAVFLYDFPHDSPVSRSRTEAGAALRRLLQTAKTAGDLRQDVDVDDVMLLLKAHDGVVRWSSEPEQESQRLIERFLRSLHT
ncbi:TetR family transcriptional regulator [Streptomyces zinciresistens K42]|uniref:TetR family transcriptional regulator n=1 Tax=Streptomyces zinciresistens K42 TaxID=700597 RepID=G2GLA0_9ACTN|nr:TetR/AcrR family transcriptional regulator [Streptomyces zinciresistens]EGX55714.1 TetR family transcriptional regulator [Streptomyces zinciresistens K42]